MITKTYRIPEENIEPVTTRLAKINAKAHKLGVRGVTFTTISEEIVEVFYVAGDEANRVEAGAEILTFWKRDKKDVRRAFQRWVTIELTGESPMLNGWRFIATIQHAGEAGNIMRNVPGETVPTKYRDVSTNCEHCNTKRMRKDTYIVANDETYKQVGGSCLRDFLGGNKDPHGIASWAEWLGVFDEELTNKWGVASGISKFWCGRDEVLQRAAANIRAFGWFSAGKAYEQGGISTKSRVVNDMWPKTGHEVLRVEDADKARAVTAMEWAQTNLLDANTKDLNEYLYNLRVACASEVVETRSIGLLVSLIATSERDTERRKEQEKREREGNVSQHIGTVGERLEVTLTCKSTRSIETAYGLSTLYTFDDGAGNTFKWFATGSPDIEVGGTYAIRGTVKKHDEFRGAKQTLLTRCKVVIDKKAKAKEKVEERFKDMPDLWTRMGMERKAK